MKTINQDAKYQDNKPQGNSNVGIDSTAVHDSDRMNPEEAEGISSTPDIVVNDKRFFMSVKLDNTRVIRDLQKYLDEVIVHLNSTDNCEVELSLEVSAFTEDGFSQSTVRTISENCHTLKVDSFGFEK